MNHLKKITPLLLVLTLSMVFSCSKSESEIKPEPLTIDRYEINEEMAISIALEFSSSRNLGDHSSQEESDSNSLKSSKKNKEKKIKKTSAINCDDGKPAFFVIEYIPTGFVIISAHKKTKSILAFSETGVYQYDPAIQNGFNGWVDHCKEVIKALRKGEIDPDSPEIIDGPTGAPPPEGEEETASGGTVIHKEEGPFLSTTWGQQLAYNDQCPNLNCTGDPNAPAGCVPVAIGQIMKHWEYPTSYTWTSMPDNYGSYETALLLSEIGEDIDADYSCTVTTAYMADARDALVNDYGYSSSASYLNYSLATVEDQIDNEWPVVLRGTDSSGGIGHAWVCDGYMIEKHITIHNPGDPLYEYETYTYTHYLYMNWGNYGINDGYCLSNLFAYGGNSYNYNKGMLINIHL